MKKISNGSLPLNVLLCMKKEYANSFIKNGVVHFSCAKKWSNYQEEDSKNDLQGDLLEGVIACTNKEDNILYPNTEYEKFDYDDRIFVKSKRSIYLPAYCFYSFGIETVSSDDFCKKVVSKHQMNPTYFESFLKSSQISRDELIEAYRFVCIPSFEVFYSRLLRSLSKKNIYEDKIILQKIEYSDEKESIGYNCKQKSPKELFEKSTKFKDQHEYRIILNCDDLLIDSAKIDNGYEIVISPLDNAKSVKFNKLPSGGLFIEAKDDVLTLNLEQRSPSDFWIRLLKYNHYGIHYTEDGEAFTYSIDENDKAGIIFNNKISFAGLYDCIKIVTSQKIYQGMDVQKKKYVLSVFNNITKGKPINYLNL